MSIKSYYETNQQRKFLKTKNRKKCKNFIYKNFIKVIMSAENPIIPPINHCNTKPLTSYL